MASFTWLLALTLRSTVVLAVALALGALLRRRTAVARHRLLTLTAIGLLLLPALPGMLPRWELRLPSDLAGGARAPLVEALPRELVPAGRGERARVSAPPPAPAAPPGKGVDSPATSLGAAAATLWLIGVLTSLVGLARALRRERRMLSASRPLDGPWMETFAEVRRSLGVSRPVRLLTCERIHAPLTGGFRRPAVLLPPGAALWSAEKRRVVLQHELVHVLRGDALRHLVWRVVASLYWFHPLARLAEREASVVGEHACDETVLDLGTRPSAYARHLLDIADSLRREPLGLAGALSMVDRSQLERRLFMILDPNRPASRGRAMAAVSLAVLALTVAAAGAAMPSTGAHPPAKAAARSTAAAPAAVAADATTDVCMESTGGTFSGTYSEGPSGTDVNGVENGDFALHQPLGDGRRLCARVHGPVRFDERSGAIRELPRGRSVSVETRGRGRSQRMLVTADQGEPRYQWWLDGSSRTPDDTARAWLADALELVAAYRAIGKVQGQVGSLQGEIGEIQGQVGSLQGEIGEVQGEEGSLQGKIGSIQGEVGGLQGEIGGHQGAIGGLEAGRWQASASDKARIDGEIAAHQAAIEKLEGEIASRQFDRRIADAQAELRAAEEKGGRQIAELERRIKDIHADEKIARLERKIADLHAEDRIAEIERGMKPALDRLKASLQHLGS